MSSKVSVVTVCFNAIHFIESTIQSVIEQDYKDIEYIIIDGGSSDGTLDVIEKYRAHVDILTSESDNGIYDAMNKAVDLCSGEWVNFMNAGDTFYDSRVISSVIGSVGSEEQIVYGDYILRDPIGGHFDLTKIVGMLTNLYKGMNAINLCHQTMFCKRSVLAAFPFNVMKKTSSDFEFIYTVYKEGVIFFKYNGFVANYLRGGFSTDTLVESRFRDFHIVKEYNSGLKVRLYYWWSICFLRFRLYVKSRFGSQLWERVRKLVYGQR